MAWDVLGLFWNPAGPRGEGWSYIHPNPKLVAGGQGRSYINPNPKLVAGGQN
jgi:hypothetical protein